MTQADMKRYAGLPRYALSIRQPWAHQIAAGYKDIENRSWGTRSRGSICIHASKWKSQNVYDDDYLDYADLMSARFTDDERATMTPQNVRFGCVIGVADIVDCVKRSQSRWFVGPYGLVLANARAIDPVPVRGALGFYEWRNRIIAPDTAALGEAAPSIDQGALL